MQTVICERRINTHTLNVNVGHNPSHNAAYLKSLIKLKQAKHLPGVECLYNVVDLRWRGGGMDCVFLWSWLVCVCTNHLASWWRVFLAVSGLFALFPHLRLLSSLPSLSPLNETHHKCNSAVSILGVCVSDMRYWTVITYGTLLIFDFMFQLPVPLSRLAADVSDVRIRRCLLGQKLCCLEVFGRLLQIPRGTQKLNTQWVRKRWTTVVHTFF